MYEMIAAALVKRDGMGVKHLLEEELGLPVSEVLIFGSRAKGTERPTSDIDAVAFLAIDALPRQLSCGIRCSTPSGDLDLDIQCSRVLDRVSKHRLYWNQGLAIYDPQKRLHRYLARLARREKQLPQPLTAEEVAHWQVWLERMFSRIVENMARGDQVLADYQLSWVHQELIGLYCPLHRQHSLSPRDLHSYFQAKEPEIWDTLVLLAAAAQMTERLQHLKQLEKLVWLSASKR